VVWTITLWLLVFGPSAMPPKTNSQRPKTSGLDDYSLAVGLWPGA
jgi:hypothetical protein